MKNINLKEMSKSDLQLLIEKANEEIKRPRLTREEKQFLSFFKDGSVQITDDYVYIEYDKKDVKTLSTLIPKDCLSGVPFNDLESYRVYIIKDLIEIPRITLTEFWGSSKKLAIYCATEEKASKLCEAFDRFGKIWVSGRSYKHDNSWAFFGVKTCYTNNGYSYSFDYCECNGIIIYKFEDVDLEGYEK